MNRRGICFVALFLSFLLVTPSKAQVGRGKFGFGLSVSGNTMQSDWATNDPGFGGSADISYSFGKSWGVVSSLGIDQYQGKYTANQKVVSTIFHASLALSYEFLRDKPLNPFIYAGGGWMLYTPRLVGGRALYGGQWPPYDIFASGGLGFDFYVSESWSLIVTAEAGYFGTDNADGLEKGSNDIYGRVSVGVRYYLFDRSTVEEIVKTVQKRLTGE